MVDKAKPKLMDGLKAIKKGLKARINLYKALYADARTPRKAKIFLWLALGYIFLPFDLIPDFIPVIGHLDDAIIIPLLIYLAIKAVPKELYQELAEIHLTPSENN